jgi:thiol:disulfide interchange protein
MNSKMWIGIVAAIVILGGGAWVLTSQNKPADKMMPAEEKMMTKDEMVMMEKENMAMSGEAGSDSGGEKDAMMKKDNPTPTASAQDAMMMKKEGAYKDYSSQTVASEQAAGQKVVLFFHASWCPTCKAADNAFKANTGKIPAGVTVLKTDYDNSKDLKTKHGITTQHTFVQIDNEGNMITKWVSGDVDMLIKNIK